MKLKELISQANSVAVALIKRGITKNDRIFIFSTNNIPYAVLLFASYFLGVTLVPLSPNLGVYELKQDIERMESIVIFTSVEKAKYFDEIFKNFDCGKSGKLKIKSVFVFDGIHENFIPFENLLEEGKKQILHRIPYFDIDPKNDIFLLLRSSGTSGLPKIIILTHYNFIASLIEFWKTKQFKKVIIPIFFTFGEIAGSLFMPRWLCLGSIVIILEKFDEELYFQSVEKYRINVLPIFPSFGHKLIKGELADKYDLSSVKMMNTGAVAFPANVAEAIVKKYKVIFRERMSYLKLHSD